MTEIDFIAEVLQEAGAYARERYRNRAALNVQRKSSATDLVTEVDIRVQSLIVERIQARFPGDLVLAEESGFHARPEGRHARCWVLDPIDGTSNFVRGMFPAWGVSLAFAEREVVHAGGVYFPMTDDMFLAERGAGATRNGEPTAPSSVAEIDVARMELDISSARYRKTGPERAPELFRRIGQLRIHGSAVVGLCSIATGDMEGYLHAALNPWDYAAGVLIVEEAGGRATRWDGSPLTLFDGRNSIVATNGALHEHVLPLLKPATHDG
jgi:myo-inositol-1(or 4)-monophosphatase